MSKNNPLQTKGAVMWPMCVLPVFEYLTLGIDSALGYRKMLLKSILNDVNAAMNIRQLLFVLFKIIHL